MSIIPPAKAESLHEFCAEVCRGNEVAMQWCDLWMVYCHEIDDLIDTREDGRPTFSAEQILKIPINALILYNHPFYLANRENLMPLVLSITNAYADSVQFEKAADPTQRSIADIIRCCGNEMFMMVALICGGWEHMRKVSPRIRVRSYQLQHDNG